ncbi:unnamed protein product [Staurois parvus]|uniref:Uncharacterized protein n=1 Tax=Staurois parvus TaxID=386267 RepID=A0ABN9A808_9NEOB|nr:unnamed protein product [Staurois parvus]
MCERMGHSQELSEFKRGIMICCHLCNKSIYEMSLLLNIPRSIVSGIITKWKQLGKTARGKVLLLDSRAVEMCFSGVRNHASLSGNPMDVSEFGGCQENGTCLTALCQV